MCVKGQINSLVLAGKVHASVYITMKRENYKPSGLAHFRFSMDPVFGHRISCHDMGIIIAPLFEVY